MATVAITPTQINKNEGFTLTQGAGTAIVQANTNTIAYPKDGKLLITIDSDHADTTAVVASGFGTEAGLGTVSYAVGDTVIKGFIVGDSARIKNASGNISITWATNSAGYIRAFYLPPA